MGSEVHFDIPIPSDDDGYVLLQCEHCGSFFKVCPSDVEDDCVLNIFCPSCGLISDNYLTNDVLELAGNMVENYANDLIYNAFKDLERKTKSNVITFTAGKKPRPKPENPIRAGIEAMEIASFPCCGRSAKIKPLLKMTGGYCPFCGVKNYEIE